jgi:hypothetical protein
MWILSLDLPKNWSGLVRDALARRTARADHCRVAYRGVAHQGRLAPAGRAYSPGSLQMGSPIFRSLARYAVRDRPPHEVGGGVRRSSFRHR